MIKNWEPTRKKYNVLYLFFMKDITGLENTEKAVKEMMKIIGMGEEESETDEQEKKQAANYELGT